MRERPVEGASAAAEALDLRVEEELGGVSRGSLGQHGTDAEDLPERGAHRRVLGGVLVAVQLHRAQPHRGDSGAHLAGWRPDEHPDPEHAGGEGASDLGGLREGDVAACSPARS
jgi:hypothetical protein